MKIAIVGGGTAGWMAACYLVTKFKEVEVLLIEDPKISKINVGESVSPIVSNFFRDIGVNDIDMMRKTNATYKIGVKLTDYAGINTGSEYLSFNFNFHKNKFLNLGPITSTDAMIDSTQHRATDVLIELIKQGRLDNFQKYWFTNYHYLNKNVGLDSLFNDNDFFFDKHYARTYHINAEAMADYLRDNIGKPNSVIHILSSVDEVILKNNIEIDYLKIATGESIRADLFLDCTGFAKVLINKFNWSVKLYKDHKIDRAWVCQLEYENRETELCNYTHNESAPNGWIFTIPLFNRAGCGYCFSSEHTTDDQAFNYYMSKTKNHISTPRLLKWIPNRLENVSQGNVVAIGLSAGFIEPQESNSLKIVVSTIYQLDSVIKIFNNTSKLNFIEMNNKINETIDNIADYTLCFYTTSNRKDTKFWNDFKKLGEVKNHKNLIYKMYMNPESSLLRTIMKKRVLLFDQIWLALYIRGGNSLNNWSSRFIESNILDAAEKYFIERDNELNKKSSNELPYSQWLENTVFRINQDVE